MNASVIKSLVYFVTTVLVLPLFLVYLLLSKIFRKGETFASFSQLLSLFPGKTGSFVRNSFYHMAMNRCEYGVVFSFGTLFSQYDTDIAAGTYIGPQCNIGSCSIGQDCLLGSGVHVLSGKQQHNITNLDIPIRDQGGALEKINIGRDCWIGNGAIIMADIGEHCVVAAGSVVVNPITDRQIVAGNPAKEIKKR